MYDRCWRRVGRLFITRQNCGGSNCSDLWKFSTCTTIRGPARRNHNPSREYQFVRRCLCDYFRRGHFRRWIHLLVLRLAVIEIHECRYRSTLRSHSRCDRRDFAARRTDYFALCSRDHHRSRGNRAGPVREVKPAPKMKSSRLRRGDSTTISGRRTLTIARRKARSPNPRPAVFSHADQAARSATLRTC